MSFDLPPSSSQDLNAYQQNMVDPLTPVIRVALQEPVTEPRDHLVENPEQDDKGEHCGVNHRLSFHIDGASGSCCRSPSPKGGRRLSAPVSTGSPSHLRRCSVEEPYVFSVAQAAVAAGQQLLRPQPPASVMLTTGRTSPIPISSSPADRTKTPEDHQMIPATLSPDGDLMVSGCERSTFGSSRWEFVAIGGSSFGKVIRRPSQMNDEPDHELPSAVDEYFLSSVGDTDADMLYQQSPRSVVVSDPASSISDVHYRRSARSMSLTQGRGGHGRFDLFSMKSHSVSSSETQAQPTYLASEFPVSDTTVVVTEFEASDASGTNRDIDFLKLPSEWSAIDDATGLPRRRHSVASGRMSASGQLESIAEESSGAGSSGSGGQCLLKPKGSIRRYSIPETILAAHASSST